MSNITIMIYYRVIYIHTCLLSCVLCVCFYLCFIRGVSKPNKSTQRTLDTLFVKGGAKLVDEAKRLGENFSLAQRAPSESYEI